jgi:hypothetical protein
MMLRKDGRTDGSVTISLRNFVGEGITKVQTICQELQHKGHTRNAGGVGFAGYIKGTHPVMHVWL